MLEMVKTKAARHAIDPRRVHEFMKSLFEEDFHAQRVFSMATGVVDVMHAAAASIHAIGLGLAIATGRESKHADRLLSNAGIDVSDLFEPWVRFALAEREEIVVALDWTEFDGDGHMTLALHLIPPKTRASTGTRKRARRRSGRTRSIGKVGCGTSFYQPHATSGSSA